MATVTRKSSIRKAPAADVVESLTQPSINPQAAEKVNGSAGQHLSQGAISAEQQEIVRPGPGRPRSKRRMEPFSSKIEINLRDNLDEYLAEHGMTVVDFLDQAIRDRLRKQ